MNNDDQAVMKRRKDIYNVKGMAESARYTEYKHLESAVSEIIDNSIEATADKVFVIFTEVVNIVSGRKEIKDIAFLDNGIGMDYQTLHGCLSFGEGTRKDRKGIGRFGVGLAQASMYACPRVEVLSCYEPGDMYKVFLDSGMMASGDQEFLEEPESCRIPSEYASYFRHYNIETGTLVIWRNVDKTPVKKASTMIRRLEEEIGRVFRHYLHSNEVEIFLVNNENLNSLVSVKPRDPLFLFDDDEHLANRIDLGKITNKRELGEPIFEPFVPSGEHSHIIEKPIKISNDNGTVVYSTVRIKFSIVNEALYSKLKEMNKSPGDSDIGKVTKRYNGISIVRARREVDFGKFDFYESENNPNHRWWGCEVQFDSLLDEKFKISNNKQHIELKKPLQSEIIDAENESEELLWIELNSVIGKGIREMVKLNKERQAGARTKSPLESSAAHTNESDTDKTVRLSATNQVHEGLFSQGNSINEDFDNEIAAFVNGHVDHSEAKECEEENNLLLNKIASVAPEYLLVDYDNDSKYYLKAFYKGNQIQLKVNARLIERMGIAEKITIEQLIGIFISSFCKAFAERGAATSSITYIQEVVNEVNLTIDCLLDQGEKK